MRILGRGLIVLLLLLLSWFGYTTWLSIYQKDHHHNLATPYPNVEAERNDVYLLSLGAMTQQDNRPALSFLLDQRIERLQIAAIPLFSIPEDKPDAFSQNSIDHMREQGNLSKYAIEYTLLDEQNKILTQQNYWFNVIPTSWVTLEDQRLVPSLFLSDADYYAGTRQSIFLRMQNWPTAHRLELRMHNQPKEIAGSSVYVRQHFNRSQQDASVLWRKLSDKKRTRQTENVHMYPHYIWANSEISSLLSYYWLQLGPEGIVGKDFTTLGLFRVKAAAKEVIEENITNLEPVSSLYVNQNKHLTLPIHSEGEVQFSFRPSTFATQDNNAAGKLLTIIQHPFDGSAPIVKQQVISQTSSIWKGKVKKGLLELQSNPQVDIDLLAMQDTLSAEHTQHQTRYFLVDDNKPLTYAIDHWREQATPIKIELRAILNQPELMTDPNAHVRANWLATQDQHQKSKPQLSHPLALDFTLSRYEHLATVVTEGLNKPTLNSPSAYSVSEGKSAYFLAPKSVDQLQITSTSPVLVKISSRPLELPLRRQVPSHNRGWFDDENYLPTWFALQPNNHELLINRGDSLKLKTLHRPLVDRYADTTEELVGERFVPLPMQGLNRQPQQANLNQIMIPVADSETLLKTSPLRRYRQLNLENQQSGTQTIKLTFENDTLSNSLSPSLVFKSDTASARKVSFSLDKQTIHSQWISGYVGKVALPEMTKGTRSLALASSSNQAWYINQVDYIEGENYLVLKEGYALDKRSPLSYEITKTGSETLLNFTFYQELAPTPLIQTASEILDPIIEVKLIKSAKQRAQTAKNISNSQTIPIRQWRLQTDSVSQQEGLLLNRGSRKTDTGRHFVYSLADDLAPGKYKIQISLKEGNNGYLHVSRLVPKPGFDIDFFRESIHAY